MTDREHDPDKCANGEDCLPCLKAELRKRAATVRVDDDTRKRVAAGVVERLKSAVMGEARPGLAMLLVACALLVGCVPVEAIEQCDEQAALNHGLAVGEANPDVARAIGARQELAWRVQRLSLSGEDVPGAEHWPKIPERFLPPSAADAVRTHDAHPTRNPCEIPGNGSGPCGCNAVHCVMPCTGCCVGGCAPPPPDPTSSR